MSKIPKDILIKGKKWYVKRKRIVERDSNLLGLADFNKRTIYLKQKQTNNELKDTFTHECIHAVMDELGLNAMDDNLKEVIVNGVTEFVITYYERKQTNED